MKYCELALNLTLGYEDVKGRPLCDETTCIATSFIAGNPTEDDDHQALSLESQCRQLTRLAEQHSAPVFFSSRTSRLEEGSRASTFMGIQAATSLSVIWTS
jgi:hypothetical protein